MTSVDISTPSSTAFKQQVMANEAHNLLVDCESEINTLSLDCFDTLLWRKAVTPVDVFFDMQNKPAFKKIGMTALSRADAEKKARNKKYFSKKIAEVTLNDIYLSYDPELSETELAILSEAELAAEMETCYAFAPTIELMKQAKQKGMAIIIVSDTYLTEKQLRALLSHCLPHSVYNMIDHVFCSCEHHASKSGGIFKQVLKKIQKDAADIWHVGDNKAADFDAPQKLSIRATQLVQYGSEIAEMLRLRSLSASLLDQNIRHERSLPNPFSGVFCAATMPLHTPECAIGYLSLGPIMYAFAHFISEKVAALQSQQKNPKILFLMRDGYLPSLAYEKLTGEHTGKKVCISRFSALAASFRSKKDIDQYLSQFGEITRFQEICKQFLLDETETTLIINEVSKSPHPSEQFLNLIYENNRLNRIYKASKKYKERLYGYLKKEAGIQENDTVLFVDLGYTGTAQGKLSPVLKDDLNIDVIGCYLIASRVPQWETTRSGLIDPSWCDDRTSSSLVAYIALLEQLCTTNTASVMDYDEIGNPIFSETNLCKSQHKKLDLIQKNALEFIEDAKSFNHWGKEIHYHPQILRDYAMAEIGRLLFFPTQTEIDYLKTFKFELNMGAKDVFNMFDAEKGLEGLQNRGMYFMEKNLSSMRTNYPAELRYVSIELSILLLMQSRTRFDIRPHDFSLREEKIEVALFDHDTTEKVMISSKPTYDGYFSLIIPIRRGDISTGIFFGKKYESLQIASISTLPSVRLYSSSQEHLISDAKDHIHCEGIEERTNGLMLCQSENSFLFYKATKQDWQENHVLRIIFRPIGTRSS